MDQITTRTIHLERTSEEDKVPARWAAAQIEFALAPLTEEQRDQAVITNWRGASIEYQHRLSDLELAQARAQAMADDLRNAPAAVRDWAARVLARAGM